jgi:hypothetical protein
MERKPKQYYYYFNGAKKNLLLFLKDINFKKKGRGCRQKRRKMLSYIFQGEGYWRHGGRVGKRQESTKTSNPLFFCLKS